MGLGVLLGPILATVSPEGFALARRFVGLRDLTEVQRSWTSGGGEHPVPQRLKGTGGQFLVTILVVVLAGRSSVQRDYDQTGQGVGLT